MKMYAETSRHTRARAQIAQGLVLAIGLNAPSAAFDATSLGVDAYLSGDYDLAQQELETASHAGHPRAQYLLGTMYQNGFGVEPDEYEAFRWFREAAENELLEAQFQLGLMYLEGVGVTQNDELAMQWIWQAADRGYPQAKDVLQFMLLDDFGVGC
jgi:TPR repeat protein